MSEEKNTGIGHDDDGNVDDGRVAGWVFVAIMVGLAGIGMFGSTENSTTAIEMIRVFVWPSLILLGASGVKDKIKRGPA
jgi:hypothetical protein